MQDLKRFLRFKQNFCVNHTAIIINDEDLEAVTTCGGHKFNDTYVVGSFMHENTSLLYRSTNKAVKNHITRR